MPVRFLIAALATLLAACAPSVDPDRDTVLAIGDSVMAWNGGAGIPEVAAAALDRPVVDASRSGAKVLQPSGGLTALGLDIRKQWADNQGRWDWVLLDGGGNDLREFCRGPFEAATLDSLIAGDLSGAIPALVARIRATGSRVAMVGYYDEARAEPTAFSACQDAFTTMNERLARLAARDAGIVFLDAGEVIDPARIELYARDRIHPSPEGSRLIGQALARRMAAR